MGLQAIPEYFINLIILLVFRHHAITLFYILGSDGFVKFSWRQINWIWKFLQ
jgi:hypothetical protein